MSGELGEYRAAVKEWVSEYTSDLFRWAFFKTQNKAVAEDLVQETFLAAFKRIKGFRQESHPKTWLFQILNNKIIDHHRKRFREIVLAERELASVDQSDNVLEDIYDKNGRWRKTARPASWQTESSDLLDNIEFRKVLQFCLEELPEKRFSVIHLKYLEEKDGDEICQDLGITPSNFWQMLRRARLQLRACIELKWFKWELK